MRLSFVAYLSTKTRVERVSGYESCSPFVSSMGIGPVLVKGDCDSNYSKCMNVLDLIV